MKDVVVSKPLVSSELVEMVKSKFALIKDRDMSFVRECLVENSGYTNEQALGMEREYKRFLSMSFVVTDEKRYPVSDKVDPFWHTHLMFTHDYTRMCHTLGGRYIHHVPATTAEARARLCEPYKENTLPLYREIFGEPDPKWWPQNASICIVCCDRPHHVQSEELMLVV